MSWQPPPQGPPPPPAPVPLTGDGRDTIYSPICGLVALIDLETGGFGASMQLAYLYSDGRVYAVAYGTAGDDDSWMAYSVGR